MAVGPVGRSAADEEKPAQPRHSSGRHRRAAPGPDHGKITVERLFAVETAYLIAFTGALVLALRFPNAAVLLCGISGVTARSASREASRLAALLWDRTHLTLPTATDRARRHVRERTRLHAKDHTHTRVHIYGPRTGQGHSHAHAHPRPGHRPRLH